MPQRILTLLTLSALLSGCSSFGVVSNSPKAPITTAPEYSIQSTMTQRPLGNVTLMLAFSGGGSRAAALAYGVLEELRDTQIQRGEQTLRLLDEVDVISSVSGGSFTAAYYGLHGDKTFKKFEKVFLRQDITSLLLESVFNPTQWFSDKARTDRAIEFYEETVFKGATFGDLQKIHGPLIVINTTDLGHGSRFSFTQEYFDLLCSDLTHFPIARAVTASSSVPVIFTPVVLENYRHCKTKDNTLLTDPTQNLLASYELAEAKKDLQQYIRTDTQHKYIHLVDGGITDNLGLRAIYEVMELAGGAKQILTKIKQKPAGHFAVIAVNASTHSSPDIGLTNEAPDVETTINAVSDIQLHRYNAATIELFQQGMKRWSKALSNPQKSVTPYFIEVSFQNLKESKDLDFFNRIPTSFALTKQEADELIKAGRTLLRQHPIYKSLIQNLNRPAQN
ncbi:MAG: patatin-like phospholipase family protein [Pseudomonadota bacterium]|nr:patatin-like phospholipase family protein [Pseudomonadota bacterium]